jgi:hypothetical protein
MIERTCSRHDCERPHHAHGWCCTHYLRWRKGQDLDAPIHAKYNRPPDVDPVTWFWRGFTRAESGCMEWQRGRVSKGYGACADEVGSGSGDAHIEAYFLTHGPIPDGMQVCHTCDNPPCGEPSHLWLGTAAENQADKVAKGRGARLQGEAHGRASLTEPQVRAIRVRLAAGEAKKVIASDYGVVPSTIYLIAKGKTWSHLG